MVCFAGAAQAAEPAAPDVQVCSLAAAVVAQGHQVVVYVRRGAPLDRLPAADGVRVVELAAGPPIELPETEVIPHAGVFAEQLSHAIGRQPPDVVHSHGWLGGLAALLGTRHTDVPLAHTFHRRPRLLAGSRPGATEKSSVNRRCVERAITRGADRLIASSPQEQLGLIGVGVPRNRISVVAPGVDCDRLRPEGILEPCQARFRLVLLDSPGHAIEAVAIAVRALTALPDTELVIMPGPAEVPGTPQGIEPILQLGAWPRVADRVRLEPASHDTLRRAALFRSAHAVLCLTPPRNPGAALEAMACGVPVITTTAADTLEAVIAGTTGLHVDPADPKTLALAVGALLDNTALRQGMGLAGRDRAVHRYSWAAIATETARIYHQLTDRPSTTPAPTGPALAAASTIHTTPAGSGR
jgi:glycosyltransferase involved in cell wall biosynthesis